MYSKFIKKKWDLYKKKDRAMLIHGLKTGLVKPYDDKLIEKLRTIYHGGVPASILLLSDGMTNGHCYDRALLMSRVFLDEEGDVNLLYGSVDSLRLNPIYISSEPLYADHCVVERITKDGKKYIYDTSRGFIYDKDYYWSIEHPKVRLIINKKEIINLVNKDEERYLEDIDRDKYVSTMILPMIETTFGRPNELYSFKGIELLQREIEYYKKLINYDDVVEEIDSDMRSRGLKK